MMKPVGEIIKEFPSSPESLIPVLQELQARYQYLSEENLKSVSRGLNLPLHHVFSVATFYKVFTLKPKGRNIVRVCLGSACHIRGASVLLEEIERVLKIRSGETNADGSFSLETVNCLGCCAFGPVMVVNEEYHGQMTPQKVEQILKEGGNE